MAVVRLKRFSTSLSPGLVEMQVEGPTSPVAIPRSSLVSKQLGVFRRGIHLRISCVRFSALSESRVHEPNRSSQSVSVEGLVLEAVGGSTKLDGNMAAAAMGHDTK